MFASESITAPFQQLPALRRSSSVLPCVLVTPAEHAQLLRWVRARTSPHRLVVRSRIVLLAGDGLSTGAIAARLHVSPATVRLWCRRFHRQGVGALVHDAPGRGRRPGMSRTVTMEVLRAMLEARAAAGGACSARALAVSSRDQRNHGVAGVEAVPGRPDLVAVRYR